MKFKAANGFEGKVKFTEAIVLFGIVYIIYYVEKYMFRLLLSVEGSKCS
jgi:hypothetical protein